LNIAYIFADSEFELNTSNYLCFIPGRAMDFAGHNVALIHIGMFDSNAPECKEILEKAQIIVVERNFKAITLAMVQDWRIKGKVVIGVFDDAYHLMEKSNKAYSYWVEGLLKPVDANGERIKNQRGEYVVLDASHPHPMKLFRLTLETFHGYHTPSKLLTSDFIDSNPNGKYIPNYFDTEMYTKAFESKKSHFGTIVGWGGSLSHFQSFNGSGIINSIKRTFRNRKDLTLMVCGDKQVFDLFPVETDRKIFMPYVKYDKWPEVLSTFDLGLAPLFGEYDKRRSWIKVGEFLMMGTPWIASDNSAYDDYKGYGNIVPNESKKWDEVLNNVLDNLKQEKEKVMDIGRPFALQFDAKKNVNNILLTYKSIAEANGFKVSM